MRNRVFRMGDNMAGVSTATSWFTSGPHLRVYTIDGNTITEQCWDDGGPWYKGAFSGTGDTVGATSWLDSSKQIHLRVYVAENGMVKERCWDKDKWYTGAFESPGLSASATSWVDASAKLHIRVYVQKYDNSVIEKCWDDAGPWYDGVYHGHV